ncbi:hypothetical protein B0T26DRAFT_724121 [Lasiosphaeria miniovina]|uniref:U1-C C2H2-type zinc finger domain-containing protein n=1 Tax=Lasiosphaeria miniovina TaxID=1954250 RepID=A0AA40A6M0_9PEZI|nr:uncharacterized protein B0T26DRAFT_724121 [Lasiosphaeria miniovina]KAK0710116.1 hypothetical protein B0T26DRAFT_724121 [Lasiosphaeria miniovina]
MSEYWKSTPKYWCKHCSIFVRDTGLERANHESTGKHQGAIKRSLRDLLRNAEQKERDEDRAKREVERLNGIVSKSIAPSAQPGALPGRATSGGAPPPQQATEEDRKRQIQQLAEMGVNIPTPLRGDLALPGEWTVSSTRIIKVNDGEPEEAKEEVSDAARAVGVKRERERTEAEKKQEEAINGLFKRPRRWGIDSKRLPTDEDAELDALLSGPLVKMKKEETAEAPKLEVEDSNAEDNKAVDSKAEGKEMGGEETREVAAGIPPLKREPSEDEVGMGEAAAIEQKAPELLAPKDEGDAAAVVFKKRKPKNIRQK